MRRKMFAVAAALLGLTWLAGPVMGQFDGGPGVPIEGFGGPAVEVTATVSHKTIAPGRAVLVAVHGRISGQYWLYSATPRGTGVKPEPLRVTVSAPGWIVGEALYPRPMWHSASVGGIRADNLVYEHAVTVLVPVTAPADVAYGRHELTVGLTGQLCDNVGCYQVPGRDDPKTVTVSVEVGAAAAGNPNWSYAPPAGGLLSAAAWDRLLPATPPKATTKPAGSQGRDVADEAACPWAEAGPMSGVQMAVWAALGLALLAGIGLNVMPCVLPVIPLKIMALTEQAKQSRRRSITLGMAYAAGILAFFVAMGVLSAAVRTTTGHLLGLNEPFKYPAVLIAMGLMLVLAALWLLDLYSINIGLRAGGVQGGQGHLGAAGTGFLTAVLATPCSGPVLASVFTWAQGQPVWLGVAVFVLLGLGMAAPHAVLAAFPGLIAKLPRPGLWMERFKQAMALVLLIVAVWLFSTLGRATWIAWVTAYAVVLSLCVWVAGRWVGLTTPTTKRRITRAAALVVAVAAGLWMLPEPAQSAIPWQPFDKATLARASADSQVVLVKFTANWCTICKIVDARIYDKQAVADELARRDVAPILGDVSQDGTPAEQMLSETLREPGPPLTLILGPGADKPIRLRGVFSTKELYDALDRAAGRQ